MQSGPTCIIKPSANVKVDEIKKLMSEKLNPKDHYVCTITKKNNIMVVCKDENEKIKFVDAAKKELSEVGSVELREKMNPRIKIVGVELTKGDEVNWRKQVCCQNCKSANNEQKTNFDTHHSIMDPNCPVYKRHHVQFTRKIMQ